METNRGRQVLSNRDIAKKKSASHSPKTNTKRGNSHSLERKVAALKDAEERCEMEFNKPLEIFAAKDYKTRNPTKTKPLSKKKQIKPRKSLAGFPDKNVDIIDSSSDEDNKNIQKETTKE